MPKDYALNKTPAAEMRRPEYACDDVWIAGFLARVRIGHLATHWDEQPFITPTNFWYDAESHAIYLHTNLTGRLHANAGRHPQACFEACEAAKTLPANTALEFAQQYESVVVFGSIQIVKNDDEKQRALHGLISRYFPGLIVLGIIGMTSLSPAGLRAGSAASSVTWLAAEAATHVPAAYGAELLRKGGRHCRSR